MNLSNIHIVLEVDGFHIVDNHKEIADGILLGVKYETSEGWISKEFEFERDRPTLLHPFRRSMFIYTGGEPLRVFIEGYEASQKRRAGLSNSQSDSFYCYPDAGSSSWSDDHLPFFLGTEFDPGRVDPSFLEVSPELEDDRLPEVELSAAQTSLSEPAPAADMALAESPEPNAY